MNDSSKIIRHNDGSCSVDYGDLVLPVAPPGLLQPPPNIGLEAFCEFMESMRDVLVKTGNTREEKVSVVRFQL